MRVQDTKGVIAVKELYSSPELEVILFLPAYRLANSDPLAEFDESDPEGIPDVTVPGSQIPGWGKP